MVLSPHIILKTAPPFPPKQNRGLKYRLAVGKGASVKKVRCEENGASDHVNDAGKTAAWVVCPDGWLRLALNERRDSG
ncbi:hypothetical protein CEXT_173031 [Caerostris extrusa]|uniref:Uncharacterized protein n=1 Tax=Caerostris extrusa TaxID=172846 RepID=A0AAV4PA75_CAEEX|nr:hypothetical protein CEXT_173031 [Caerostris extrusa]